MKGLLRVSEKADASERPDVKPFSLGSLTSVVFPFNDIAAGLKELLLGTCIPACCSKPSVCLPGDARAGENLLHKMVRRYR